MSLKRKTIEQICHEYAIIDAISNEWLFEARTYGECVSKVREIVPLGMEYVIVAILKQATRK
jgi:hypothetical protein